MKSNVIIQGVSERLTPSQVKQSLAALYQKPEDYFDKLCHALFVSRQSFTLIRNIDSSTAKLHIEQLENAGLKCTEENSELELSLTPIPQADRQAEVCPACDREAGKGEICQHCGVVIQKYLEHQKFDEQFSAQLQSAERSQNAFEKRQKEKSLRQSKIAVSSNKKRSQSNENASDASTERFSRTGHNPVISVVSAEQNDLKLYVTAAGFFLLLIMGGYFLHFQVNRHGGNDTQQVAATESVLPAPVPVIEQLAGNEDGPLPVEPQNPLEVEIERRQKRAVLSERMSELIADERPYTAIAIANSQNDLSERLYAKQELIKHTGVTEKTEKELLRIQTLAMRLDNPDDAVDILLNQARVYRHLEINDRADVSYEQAKALLNNAEDVQQRALMETAFAEYYSDSGDFHVASSHYQKAKTYLNELEDQDLKDMTYGLIALSEASRGLVDDAESTVQNIEFEDTLTNVMQLVDTMNNLQVQQDSSDGIPTAGDAGTGDPLLDELVRMTEHNKEVFQSLNSLLEQ